MGHVSQFSRGYNHGFNDGFMNHIIRYKLKKYKTVLDKFLKSESPEKDYIEGYEIGYKQGTKSRIDYINLRGHVPNNISDIKWLQEERKKIKLDNHFKEQIPREVAFVKSLYSKGINIKDLISNGLIKRAIDEAKILFYDAKFREAYNTCVILSARQEKLRLDSRNNVISKEDKGIEFAQICTSLLSTIDEELINKKSPNNG